jgi:hypothetical protein
LLACLAFARPAIALPIAAIPLPPSAPETYTVRDFGLDLEARCTPVYLDETYTTGYYLAVGAGVELADDLHGVLTETQAICGFDFGYFNPGNGNVSATVTVYANDEFDPGRGAVIAGPYVLHGLPPGANAFHVDATGGVVMPHSWLGVAFDDANTGLLSFGPPTLGTSHEIVFLTPPGVVTNFGGHPPADLFLGLDSSPATPARASTWGSLKAHYR